MPDLRHTPISAPSGFPLPHKPGDPDGAYYVPMPSCFICTECGCFYLPTEGAVCGNKVVKMLKETVL